MNTMDKIEKIDSRTVYDIETTGLDKKSDDIIQLSAFRYDETGLLETLDTYVATDIPLNDLIIELTGITQDMIPDFPNQEEAIQWLQDFTSKSDAIIGFNNITFDDEFLKNKGFDFSNHLIQDVYQMVQRWNPVKEEMENMKLETFKDMLGIEARSHTSDADVFVTNALYEYWFEHRPTPTTGNVKKKYKAILDGDHKNMHNRLRLFDQSIVDVFELDNDPDEPKAPLFMISQENYKGKFTIYTDELKALHTFDHVEV